MLLETSGVDQSPPDDDTTALPMSAQAAQEKEDPRTIADDEKNTITVIEIKDAQSRDTFYKQMAQLVGTPHRDFTPNQRGVLIKRANIDGLSQ